MSKPFGYEKFVKNYQKITGKTPDQRVKELDDFQKKLAQQKAEFEARHAKSELKESYNDNDLYSIHKDTKKVKHLGNPYRNPAAKMHKQKHEAEGHKVVTGNDLNMKRVSFSEEKMKGEDPCWKDYEMVGHKMKNGKKVPNCVPKEETSMIKFKSHLKIEEAVSSIEKALQDTPKGLEIHMKHKETGKIQKTTFLGTHSAVKAAHDHIKQMGKKGYEFHSHKLIEEAE
jgi:hypothetical protein